MTIRLDEVKAHLNITTDEDDGLLLLQIEASEAWISRWLSIPLSEMTDVPADLKQAVLMLTGHYYEHREASLVGVSAEDVRFGLMSIIDNSPYRTWGF